MNLPIKAIVIVVIAVLVIVAIAMFFLRSGGLKMEEARAREIFSSSCLNLCGQELAGIEDSYPEFIDACESLYNTRSAGICLAQCSGSCVATIDACKIICLKENVGKENTYYVKVLRARNPECKC